jgi:hypothetical protein
MEEEEDIRQDSQDQGEVVEEVHRLQEAPVQSLLAASWQVETGQEVIMVAVGEEVDGMVEAVQQVNGQVVVALAPIRVLF